MTAQEAKKEAQFLSDMLCRPFTVLYLKREPSFYAAYRTDRVINGEFDADWTACFTIYPWSQQ